MHGLKLRRLPENMPGSSNWGNDGRNSPTGADSGGGGENGIMLFGVRLTAEGSTSTNFRKSFSMNNLSQYDQPTTTAQDSNADTGYASADDVVHHASDSGRSRERKRGVPWTEEEHRMFLLGLQKVGKGDWRGISRNFVKTRTPTQVASHAQKYFLRRNNQNRRRRRYSLFDITTASFVNSTIEEEPEGDTVITPQPTLFAREFPMSTLPLTLTPASIPAAGERSIEKITFGSINQGRATPNLIRPSPIFPVPPSAKMADLNLNHTNPEEEDLPLTLNLNLSSTPSKKPPPSSSTRSSAFQSISGGDSIISVA